MNAYRIPPLVLACVVGLACATSHGRFDADASAPFAAYRSFAIIYPESPVELHPMTGDVAHSQLVERRVQAALERDLAAKGLALAPAESADLLIMFNVSTRRTMHSEPYMGGLGMGWPYGWWHDHWDVAYTHVYTEGLMIVDLIDAKTRQLVWRGWTKDPLPVSEDMSGVVDHAVGEILENYPPPAEG